MEEGEVTQSYEELEEGEIEEECFAERKTLGLGSFDVLSLGSINQDVDLRCLNSNASYLKQTACEIKRTNVLEKLNLPAKDVDLRILSPNVKSSVKSNESPLRSSSNNNNSRTTTSKNCARPNCPKRTSPKMPSRKRFPSVNRTRNRSTVPSSPRVMQSSKPRISGANARQTTYLEPRQPPTIRCVSKDASYEDLLEQYRRIKIELNHIKKEEKHVNELPKSNKEIRQPSRSPARRGELVDTKFKRRKSKDTGLEKSRSISIEEEEDLKELRRMALESTRRTEKIVNHSEAGQVRDDKNNTNELPFMDNYEQVDMDIDSDFLPSPCNHTPLCTDLSEVEMDTGDDNNHNEEEEEKALRESLLEALSKTKKSPVTETDVSVPPKENIPEKPKEPTIPQPSSEKVKEAKPDEAPTNTSEIRPPLEEISQHQLPNQNAAALPPTNHNIPVEPVPKKHTIVSNQDNETRNARNAHFAKQTLSHCHKFVINLADDSSSSSEEENDEPPVKADSKLLDGLDAFIQEARIKSDSKKNDEVKEGVISAVSQLSKSQQLEYRKLKEELARRNPPVSNNIDVKLESTAPAGSQLETISNNVQPGSVAQQAVKLQQLEKEFSKERLTLLGEVKRMSTLKGMVNRHKKQLEENENHIKSLLEQLTLAHKDRDNKSKVLDNLNGLVEKLSASVSERRKTISKVQNECLELGKNVKGQQYKVPINVKGTAPVRKRSASNSSLLNAKKVKGGDAAGPAQSNARLNSEKVRLQKLEREVAQRLEELKKTSQKPLVIKPHSTSPPKRLVLTSSKTTNVVAAPHNPKESSPLKSNNTHGTNNPPVPMVSGSKKNLAKDFFLQDDLVALNKNKNTESSPNKIHEALIRSRERLLSTQQKESQTLTSSSNYIGLSEKDTDMPTVETLLVSPENETDDLLLKPYVSPLLHLRSYRLNPNFTELQKNDYCDARHANKLDCFTPLCRFDLAGTCNDSQCHWQHASQYKLTNLERFMDLLAYAPEVAGVKPTDSSETIHKKIVNYVKRFVKKPPYNPEKKIMKLLNLVRGDLGLKGHRYACKMLSRRWTIRRAQINKKQIDTLSLTNDILKGILGKASLCVRRDEATSLDFVAQPSTSSVGQEQQHLEAQLKEEPQNAPLWLQLAHFHLQNVKESWTNSLTRALHTLSRALDCNQGDSSLWHNYLRLYSQHQESSDLLSMCQQALEYTNSYLIWWLYLELSYGYDAKAAICSDLLELLVDPAKVVSVKDDPDQLSHALLEVVFYWVQLSIQTARTDQASNLFQMLLGSVKSNLSSILDFLSSKDCAFFWLVYAHFLGYNALPNHLFSSDNPGPLINKDPFVVRWSKTIESKYLSIVHLLEKALELCQENSLMIYLSLAELHLILDKFNMCKDVCLSALSKCNERVQVAVYLNEVYCRKKLWFSARDFLLDWVQKLEDSLEFFKVTAFFLQSRGLLDEATQVLTQAVGQFFKETSVQDVKPLALYRQILKCNFDQEEEDILIGAPALLSDLCLNQKELGHLWLNYSLLLYILDGTLERPLKALRRGLLEISDREMAFTLWEQFVVFILRNPRKSHSLFSHVILNSFD